jgi:hypothetical protein
MNHAAGRLIDNVHWNRGRLVGHLYLGSTLTETREFVGQTTLPTMWDTGEIS